MTDVYYKGNQVKRIDIDDINISDGSSRFTLRIYTRNKFQSDAIIPLNQSIEWNGKPITSMNFVTSPEALSTMYNNALRRPHIQIRRDDFSTEILPLNYPLCLKVIRTDGEVLVSICRLAKNHTMQCDMSFKVTESDLKEHTVDELVTQS